MIRMKLGGVTYPLFLRCNLCDLVQTLETDFLIERQREVEEAPEPAGKPHDVVAVLPGSKIDDLL